MYLEHADADLYSVKLLLSPQGNPSNDEYILDIAAYHTQQSMENISNTFCMICTAQMRQPGASKPITFWR